MTIENEEGTKKEPIVENVEPKVKKPTMEEVLAENQRLKDQNFKVIGERKEIKSKFDDINKSIEDSRQNELEKKEDYKTLLDEANSKINGLTDSLSSQKENSLNQSIAFEVQKLASDAVHVEDILLFVDINTENIDHEKGKVTDLAEQIKALRVSRPNLFKGDENTMTTKMPLVGSLPGGGAVVKSKKRKIAEMLMNKK